MSIWKNYACCLNFVDGFSELASSNVALVQVGGKHAVLPKHTTRQASLPVAVELSADAAQAFKARAVAVAGSSAEFEAERADAPHNSAELVHHNGVCLGVRAGTVCMTFRGDDVPAAAMSTATVLEVVCYASMDLLALAAATGMEGQSACNCCWCRLTAARFAEVARGSSCAPCAPTRTPESQGEDAAAHAVAVVRAVAKGNKCMPAGVNGVKEPSLLPIDPKRIIPPYLHLVLGLTNNVVQEMLADLTRLGCVDPAAALRQFEHCALLAELETCVAGAVDGLISVLPGRRYKTQVEQVVSAMEKVPAPAPPAPATAAAAAAVAVAAPAPAAAPVAPAPATDATAAAAPAAAGTPLGVAAPAGAEYVAPGQIAKENWDFLVDAAIARAVKVLGDAEKTAELWLRSGSTRRYGDSDEEDAQPALDSSKRQKTNKYAPYAEKVRAEAKVEAEEIEAAAASLRGAIAAFQAAEEDSFEEGAIDEGFGVRALRKRSRSSASAYSASGTGR